MAVILGLSAFHPDSAACLVIDGVLQSVIAEERLGKRIKHSPEFPQNAIRHVLQEAGVQLKDITHVAIARNENANYIAKMDYVLKHPIRSAKVVAEHFRRRGHIINLKDSIAETTDSDPSKAKFKIIKVEHHLAHIASAYYLSPFDNLTAGFSYDGSGDFVSAMSLRCEGSHVEILDRIYIPHSLGFFYTALCQFIGFTQFGEEYKVMGLAPYGEDVYAEFMEELVQKRGNGRFSLNTSYFGMDNWEDLTMDENGNINMGRCYTNLLINHLGPPRERNEPIGKREKDIAKSCQSRFEEIAIHCINHLHEQLPSNQIAMAGGCSLNGVTNTRILRDTAFQKQYIQCAASDDGTCLGAAYYCWHMILKQNKRFHMYHAYWGPEYSDERLCKVSESSNMLVKRYDNEKLLDVVSDYLVQGKVVGWYQSKSEWGPRALGNRSILANPTLPDMKDIINAKIKKRESFRPFAPTVLKEFVGVYFEQDIESPFMMHVVKIRPEWRAKLPAITHVDGTGRLQSLSRESNPRFYDLIEVFRRKTGVAVLLNTSFNENEPIVDTPEQAMACFIRTDIDVLCLGNYVIVKP